MHTRHANDMSATNNIITKKEVFAARQAPESRLHFFLARLLAHRADGVLPNLDYCGLGG